jgi:dsDNA-specific endonuclease/ATPase MutS2
MRISVPTDDLDPVLVPVPVDEDRTIGRNARITSPRTGGSSRDRGAGGSVGAIQLERARTVASSLDLRGARVEEALAALERYLDDAALAGLDQVVIIHGLGTGALRDAVRERAGSHPLVSSLRPGERGEGGDGATIVKL